MKEADINFIENDLHHELRMLLGASRLVSLLEQNSIESGNTINYFKDAVYLHARNLYNFFSGETRNDKSVHDFIKKAFDTTLYINWKKALHKYVLHVDTDRKSGGNEISGKHLNQMSQDFAADIEKLWQDWIEVTPDVHSKIVLQRVLDSSRKLADDDYKNTSKNFFGVQK